MSSDSSSADDADLHPLFWSKIPDNMTPETKHYIDSFNKMIYENKSDDELAINFKERADDVFRQGKRFYDDAFVHYTTALSHCENGSPSNENRILFAKILSNRAAIHLKKKNFRSARVDVDRGIRYGMLENEKLYYRGAKAYEGLDMFAKALKAYVLPGLKAFPNSEGLEKLRDSLELKFQNQKSVRDARNAKEWAQLKAYEDAAATLRASPWRVGPLYRECEGLVGLESRADVIRQAKSCLCDADSLAFFVLWPRFSRIDFLRSVECHATSSVTFDELVSSLLPLPEEYGEGYDAYSSSADLAVDLLLCEGVPSELRSFDASSGRKLLKSTPYAPNLYEDCVRVRVPSLGDNVYTFLKSKLDVLHMVVALEVSIV